MNRDQRFGIIDIGSNSIRLVIYERTGHNAHRVIDESKASARLSEKIGSDGLLHREDMGPLIGTLLHFRLLCQAHKTSFIRAVATAAIRNAANSDDIISILQQSTGLQIDVLSGEEEARLGFLGMINSFEISDGILVDIGGGSTEVSLFQRRKLLHSVSFPFGAVNTSKKLGKNGSFSDSDIARIRHMVGQALDKEPWIRSFPGLPLVGLGGTIRNLCKIDQRAKKYSLPLTHNYEMPREDVVRLFNRLAGLSLDKRKQVEGLSGDRADIIVPGMAILHTIFSHAGCSRYIISGAGLRDGLFFEVAYPQQPLLDDVLAHSVDNLLALHPSVPVAHVLQVRRLALALYDRLVNQRGYAGFPSRSRDYLAAAAMLYRIGVTVNYYDYRQHTYYLTAHSRIDGLSHQEIMKCALIASYKSAKRTRQMFQQHKDLLTEADLQEVVKLGTILNAAIALDRSETQPISDMSALEQRGQLLLQCRVRHYPAVELREIEEIRKDFKKQWGLQLKLVIAEAASTS